AQAEAAFERAVEAQADADVALADAMAAQADADTALALANTNAEELEYLAVNSTGAGSSATGEEAVALGSGSSASGNRSVAIGYQARAENGMAVSIGAQNVASGNGAVAIGDPNFATGTGAVALGANNTATGTGAVAIGNLNSAIGNGAVALGNGAEALADGAVAIGPNAIADEVNLIALGSSIGRVRAPGITSQASRDAQQGALSLVTSDAMGNLGTANLDISGVLALDSRVLGLETQVSLLDQAVARNRRFANGGIAAAMALGGTTIVPDKDWSMSFNLATFEGQQGFSTSIVGRVTEGFYISGGITGSTVEGTTAGRVGVAFGF
ncbi:MAG: hypothetical protein AAFO28_07260, partial [Pseudomonadota bacterium]